MEIKTSGALLKTSAEGIPMTQDNPAVSQVNREVLLGDVRAALAQGCELRSGLTTKQKLQAWQAERRHFLRLACTPRPPEDRAAPKVTRQWSRQRNGYRIEGVLIQVREGQTLPAHFYVPDPCPKNSAGVLICSGHAFEGKSYASYQQAGALVAQNKMVALVTEPFDQGERIQDRNPDGSHRSWGTQSHNNTGGKALLVGWSQSGIEAWDGMIALDALAARPEVDGERLGVMGNSGGGTQSAQLFSLDERIGAAAPSCYLTSHLSLAGAAGPQDAEQWHLGGLGLGLDHADYLAVRAPAPGLICATEDDFFPIEGTRSCLAEAQKVYAAAGANDHVQLEVAPGQHGWHPPLQAAAVRWMARHLQGREVDPRPVEAVPMTPVEAQVTESGCVLDLPDEISLHTLLAREADHLARARRTMDPASRLESVRYLTRIRVRGKRPTGIWKELKHDGGQTHQKGLVQLSDGMQLPATRVTPTTPTNGPGHLIVGQGAWQRGLVTPAEHTTLWVDPLTMGDAQPNEGAWYGHFGHSARDAAWCFQLGHTLVGRQAEQIMEAARIMGEPPVLVAKGLVAIAALHAAALEPSLFADTRIELPFPSWRSLFDRANIGYQFAFLVPGALATYDLQDLVG